MKVWINTFIYSVGVNTVGYTAHLRWLTGVGIWMIGVGLMGLIIVALGDKT